MRTLKIMKTFLALATLGLTALTAKAAATLTWYDSNGNQLGQQTFGTSDVSNMAAGWEYSHVGLGTDTLRLYGEGAYYKLSGSKSDFSVIVEKSCTLTLDGYSSSASSHAQSPIVVSDGATLTLLIGEGTSTLQGGGNHAGIDVKDGGSIIIDKVEGKTDAVCILNTTGGDDGAGIGASRNSSCGDITINGGTINATGGNEAAGIGGGNVVGIASEHVSVTIGRITINGGNVTATGKDRASGIGTGVVQEYGTVEAEGIYINGGTVNATETDGRGCGIGIGEVTGTAAASSASSCGNVTLHEIVITGGTVTASAKNNRTGALEQEKAGAGIGTGIVEMGGTATIGKIEISGGDVTATGADRGAGIGAGQVFNGVGFDAAPSSATVSAIVISGGHVTATGGAEAAGIGTGVAHGSHVTSTVTEIEISGGTVTATKGAKTTGSDIGLAESTESTYVVLVGNVPHSTSGRATMDSVTVTGGSVATGTTMTNPKADDRSVYLMTVPNLTAGDEVAIVGLGSYGTNDVVAVDGTVNLSVPNGAYVFNANGRLYEATVDHGPVTANYAANTGMTIAVGDGEPVDIAYGSGEGWFYDGKKLTIDENAVVAIAGQSRLPVELVLDDGADVTLDGVTIAGESGVPAVTTTENANVTLRLDGDNTLEGGTGAAAVQPAVGATITIVDGAEAGIGQLTANGGAGAAGIGAGASTACGNVTIAGGHIEANGGTGAAGIGAGSGADGDCGTITIAGGTVEAQRGGSSAQDVGNGGGGTCTSVVVTGGSLVAEHGEVTPAPTGRYAVTIEDDTWTKGQTVTLSGLPAGYGTNDIVAAQPSVDEKIVRVYLPDGGYPFTVDGVWYVAVVDGAATNAVKASFADVPQANEGLVYTGSPLTGVPEGTGYTLTGNVATEFGHYTATATPAAGYLWRDHTMTPVDIAWYIAPAIVGPQYGTVIYDDTDGDWVVTLTNDVPGVVEIPDTYGKVTIDLNGYKIYGADGTAENPDGGVAVEIVHAAGGTGVDVTFVNNSGSASSIEGGDGADGTAEHPAGGNGGIAIVIDDAANNPSVTIGANVTVVGGNGGDGWDSPYGNGGNGGEGGAGIRDYSGTGTGTPLDSTIEDDGSIAGGNGGNGGDGVTPGNGGDGGVPNGGETIIGDNKKPDGTISDGENGSSGSQTPQGGATWLADGAQPVMTAFASDGENMRLTFAVTLKTGADFATWATLSRANGKLAVKIAERESALAVRVSSLTVGGDAVDGARLIPVGTAQCSATAAQYVSCDALAQTVTIIVPKPASGLYLYRVCILD